MASSPGQDAHDDDVGRSDVQADTSRSGTEQVREKLGARGVEAVHVALPFDLGRVAVESQVLEVESGQETLEDSERQLELRENEDAVAGCFELGEHAGEQHELGAGIGQILVRLLCRHVPRLEFVVDEVWVTQRLAQLHEDVAAQRESSASRH